MSESPRRWQVKKAARKGVMLGSRWSGALALRRLSGGPRVRVITYHRFGHVERDPWVVEPEVFEAQMRWLAEQRLAVSLEDVLAFARGEKSLSGDAVLVTMDDGFSSVLTIAAPILKRYAIPSVAYVTTSAIGNADAARGAGEAFLTWNQVVELDAGGMTIGSHGHTHRSMGRLPPEVAREEARVSRQLLEEHLGKPVRSFAYAYGMRADATPDTARILGEAGYTSVFVSQHGTIQPGADCLKLPRIKVEAGESVDYFRILCRGGMDAWSLADRVL